MLFLQFSFSKKLKVTGQFALSGVRMFRVPYFAPDLVNTSLLWINFFCSIFKIPRNKFRGYSIGRATPEGFRGWGAGFIKATPSSKDNKFVIIRSIRVTRVLFYCVLFPTYHQFPHHRFPILLSTVKVQPTWQITNIPVCT